MSRILPLDQDAVSQIHSSKHITSLQGVVFALLENSLDADSTKVDIDVDFRRGNCTIEDNGSGILASEFQEDGGLGRLYHTSKRCPSVTDELHGSTGTYLASLAALSLLSITSCHTNAREHATMTLHNGRVIARQTTSPSSRDVLMSSDHGTQVIVRDLFGNMPVRVKQRALSEDSGFDHLKAWQELKRGIAALLLAWPNPCAVRLRDLEMAERAVTLSGHPPSLSTALTEKSLNRLEGRTSKSDIRDALPILFKAGIAAPESRQRWVPVSASTASISVKGAICQDAAPTKQCQFMSLGIHPCSGESGHNELYDVVNRTIANSSFGFTAQDDMENAEKDRRKSDLRFKGDGYTQKQLQGRKGVDRWPMFVFKLRLQRSAEQQSLVHGPSEAGLKTIVDVLEATVTQWLAANHLRPHKRRARNNKAQSSPAVAKSAQGISSAMLSPLKIQNPAELLRRPATVESEPMVKKQKSTELSHRPESQGERVFPYSPGERVSSFSRIKTAKGLFYDELWPIRKPRSAPAPSPKAGSLPAPLARSNAIHIPPLEAGALSSETPSIPKSDRVPPLRLLAASRRYQEDARLQSSDDYGSVDEGALLGIGEHAESHACSTDQRSPLAHARHESTTTTADNAPANNAVVKWTDPATKRTFRVNSRTGIVLPVESRTERREDESTEQIRQCAAINTSISQSGMPLSLSRRANGIVTPITDGGWLPEFLKEWDNPVFKRQDEEPVPVALFNGPGFPAATTGKHRLTEQDLLQSFEQAGVTGSSKLSKAALRGATVIRQVDNKFILCKMSTCDREDAGGVLVLVDQHAASERVMLEKLLQELCSPPHPQIPAAAPTSTLRNYSSAVKTTVIERPLQFEISAAEYDLFGQHAEQFARWGILFDRSERVKGPTAPQYKQPELERRISVKTLPPGIAERCTHFPNLLVDLLRSEIWSLAESSARTTSKRTVRETVDGDDGNTAQHQHTWLKHIGSCPKGILDMLNSRACRSAIMFNDVLSLPECETLLADLSGCAFPFMCAHGRVSMVPLIEIGLGAGDGRVGGGPFAGAAASRKVDGEEDQGFKAAFRRWRRDM